MALTAVLRMASLVAAGGFAFTLAALSAGEVRAQAANDYPTVARADYVFACMKSNGETREALERCSCSIDVIASIVPYEDYVAAETYLSIGQVSGERGAFFRSSSISQATTTEIRRAQAEAEIRCF
jgi:hypothetical protein